MYNQNSGKQFCKRGHEFTPENTYIWSGSTRRQCKACDRERNLARRKRRVSISIEDRFWAKVDKQQGLGPNGDCWEWIGGKTGAGYGALCVNGKTIGSHIVSATIAGYSIKSGQVIRHSCDNPICVNPSHLTIGTQKDNILDKIQRGRDFNASKTHCKHGHEFTEENTRLDKRNQRVCRACQRRYNRNQANKNSTEKE